MNTRKMRNWPARILALALAGGLLPFAASAQDQTETAPDPEADPEQTGAADPAQAPEDPPPPQQIAVEAIQKKLRGTREGRQVALSQPRTTASGTSFCATTEAYNSAGQFIGLSYWEVGLSPEGEVTRLRDVTGLFSDCYSDSYKTYRPPPAGQ